MPELINETATPISGICCGALMYKIKVRSGRKCSVEVNIMIRDKEFQNCLRRTKRSRQYTRLDRPS